MAEKILKLGRQYRDSRILREDINQDKRTLALSFSSEEPVPRYYGIEVLDHSSEAADLRRLKRGGALLIDHDPSNQVGVIEEVTIDAEDRKGRAIVRFGRSAKAEEIFQDVVDGIRSNVSVGYQVNEVRQEKSGKDRPDLFRVTRWEPLEISLVSIPADISVGVGRSQDPEREVIVIIPDQFQEERSMSEDTSTAASTAVVSVEAPPARPSAQEMEVARKRAIQQLCSANKLDDKYRDYWTDSGFSLEQVADDLVKILEERGRLNPQPLTRIGMTPKETRQFSLVRAITACRDNNWTNAGFELECSRAVQERINKIPNPNTFFVPFEVLQRPVDAKRDLTVASAGAGGYLVDTVNVGFIDLLRNRSVAMRMGSVRLSGLVGSVAIPRLSVGATATWLANEASTISEQTQTFVQVPLAPKNVGAYTEISRQLLLQSSPGVEGIISNDLAQSVALAADYAVLNGAGSSGEPDGIIGYTGVGTFTGTSLGYAGLLNAQTDVAAANVTPVRGGYVTTPAVAALLMARVKYTSTASPLWEGNLWDGTCCGFPAMSTNQCATDTMVFGDWSQVVIGEWGVLEVEVNPFAGFTAGIIGIRAIYSMDCTFRIPGAFSTSSSIT